MSQKEDPLFSSAPKEYSPQQREEVKQYVADHPEIRELIQHFMEAVSTNKPEKPLEFAAEYFKNLKEA